VFTEFLRIRPRLTSGDANKMEQSLSRRFTKVAKTFSKSLKNAVKGSVLGLGLAFLAELLNPLQELEERIKDILGKGGDLDDQADKFGTDAGTLGRLTNIAASQGVTPEKTLTMLDAFAKAVDTARKEIEANRLDPGKEISAASSAVRQFIDEPDRANSFFKFIQGLQDFGKTNGIDQRRQVEENVFGERLFGNSRKFLESDLSQLTRSVGGQDAKDMQSAITKLADLNRLTIARGALADTDNLVKTGKKLNTGLVGKILDREEQQLARDRAQIDKFDTLVAAAATMNKLAGMVDEIKNAVFKIVILLDKIVTWTTNLLPKMNTLPKTTGVMPLMGLFSTFSSDKTKGGK
jgi:hypothetical protein